MGYRNISKEEIIKLANEGDSEAMTILGEYYHKLWIQKKSDYCYFQEAIKWFLLASEKGNLIALYRYILCINFDAAVEAEVGFMDSKEKWEILLQKSELLLEEVKQKKIDSEVIDIDFLFNTRSKCIYYLSIIEYFSDNFERACSLLIRNSDIRSRLLYLLCCVSKVFPRDEEIDKQKIEALEVEIQRLREYIEKNDEYMKEKKIRRENLIYNVAILTLCEYYSSVHQQHDNAVHLLKLVLNSCPDAENNDMLEERLSHYKKKFWGGYQYIE